MCGFAQTETLMKIRKSRPSQPLAGQLLVQYVQHPAVVVSPLAVVMSTPEEGVVTPVRLRQHTAEAKIRQRPQNSPGQTTSSPTTRMKCLLGQSDCLKASRIIFCYKLPKISDYWKTAGIGVMPWFQTVFQRTGF